VAECPSGYKHIGTLSENNNVEGSDLGQTQEESIEDCQALCESTEGCVAFMYGGAILKSAYSKHCKLSSIATSNNSWGSNFRFCQMLTEEPTPAPTVEPTQAPQTSSPSISPIFGKCLVDNPSNVGKPLCYVNGEQVDTCSNKGCNGCCGSQCSWVGTYCNERDGVVAKCPSGYSQVGTLSENNDIGGEGLGQSNQDSIGKCKELCESDPSCVAFMYGGANTEGDSTLCELSSSVTPNNSWGSNFRFCRKTVKCLEENPNNANKPLCFLNEVHKDTCSNKGCNGCCGSTCSWISNYCSESTVAECPIGYKQIGTLSENNDVGGSGMGQTQEESIEDCQALCESTEGCVAFMYGGPSIVHDSKLCELSNTATPNNSWGSNFRFCQSLGSGAEDGSPFSIRFGGQAWGMAKSLDNGATWTPIATVDMHTYQQVHMIGEVRDVAQEGMIIKFQPLHAQLANDLGYLCPKLHEKCDGTCTYDPQRDLNGCFNWDHARIFIHEMTIDGQLQDFSSLDAMRSSGWTFKCNVNTEYEMCNHIHGELRIEAFEGQDMLRYDGLNFYYTYTFSGIGDY